MSSLVRTRLESLSNELLLDIFEYFDGYTLSSIFYRMNGRLSNLIRLCQLHIRFDKHKRDERIWDTLARWINPAKIYALSLYGVVIHKRFLPSVSENLVSLCLYRVNQDFIEEIFQHLPTVNRIKTLCIYQKEDHRRTFPNFSYDVIFSKHGHRLTSLVNCSLQSFYYHNEPSVITVVFSKLRRLVLSDVPWTPNLVQFLRENTPNLRSLLYLRRIISFPKKLIPSVIKHIREFDITVEGDLIDLKDILSTLPSLKRLRILFDTTLSCTILDGAQWQKIIEQYLPCLQHFILDFATGIDEDTAETFYTGEFWSTKKVVMKLVINKAQSRHRQVKTIYFGRPWHFTYFDWTEDKNRCDRSLNLRRQSSSPPSSYEWSVPPLLLRPSSPSSLLPHPRSRSRSRSRLRRESRSRSRRRPQRRSRSRLLPESRPRRRPQRRSRPRSSLRRRRSHSRSRRSPPRSSPRRRSRSRPRPRLHRRLRSPSRSRLRVRRQSRSRPRSPLPRQSQSKSRSRLRHRIQRRSRSRTRLRSPAYLRSERRPK